MRKIKYLTTRIVTPTINRIRMCYRYTSSYRNNNCCSILIHGLYKRNFIVWFTDTQDSDPSWLKVAKEILQSATDHKNLQFNCNIFVKGAAHSASNFVKNVVAI